MHMEGDIDIKFTYNIFDYDYEYQIYIYSHFFLLKGLLMRNHHDAFPSQGQQKYQYSQVGITE